MIELRDVHKTLGGRPILKGMSFQVPTGTTYVLMGRSGIGKSVTLKHLVGILKPDRGEVLVDGVNVPSLDSEGLKDLRRKMGYLFQNGALINWLTVAQNVSLPLEEHSRLPRAEIRERVMRTLHLVGMDHAADLFPSKISGGMRLRAGLARAIVTEPRYVLYDEPNAGLDPIIADQIHRLIVEVRDRLGVTGLVVTHSRACAFTVANRIGVIDEGRIAEEGTVPEMRASTSPLVRAFLGGGSD
ncbi:MAG: ATP-binding cassette domain-containing protein [Planctomycetes bacterium]|nr:ATP-binding cassette domain-containing protein [Planctomycetota bacterium]